MNGDSKPRNQSPTLFTNSITSPLFTAQSTTLLSISLKTDQQLPSTAASKSRIQSRSFRGEMAAPTSQEAGPSRSPPPKEYTRDVVSTDPLTDTKEDGENEGFDDTQTIREAPPPPDVRPTPDYTSSDC
jgi:hypothetical protein